ncbi:hypothetical protein [Archangium lipolyticum]|uniref:hypothetical protein n=1 Tax=Archangium lipolyticum TaxID=2970465 RepID=UPI00214A0800|nr:hypothetical protein [Archangium lipolyticum]
MSPRACFLAFLFLSLSAPALAQDGGTDAGVVSDTDSGDGGVFLRPERVLDAGTVTLEFPGMLLGGSEVAAGLDPAAAGELIHPSNPNALMASLRSLGAPFQGGSTSVALQFNPYIVLKGNRETYQQFVDARTHLLTRVFQDSAVTLAALPGTPYEGITYPMGRFGTLATGITAELLGDQSIYGPLYSQCLARVTTEPPVSTFELPPQPRPRKRGETEQVAQARYEFELSQLEAARKELLQLIESGMARCAKDAHSGSNALFASAGGRWVTPGLNAEKGDGLLIQRGFGAVSFEWLSEPGIELTLQGRVLFDRPLPTVRMDKWVDAGASLAYAGKAGTLRLEYVRSLAKLGDTETERVSYALSGHMRLGNQWAIGLNAQGVGTGEREALQSTRIGLVVTFADSPVFEKDLPMPR